MTRLKKLLSEKSPFFIDLTLPYDNSDLDKVLDYLYCEGFLLMPRGNAPKAADLIQECVTARGITPVALKITMDQSNDMNLFDIVPFYRIQGEDAPKIPLNDFL